MAFVILQQVSSPHAKANARKTLDKPVALKYLTEYFTSDEYESLKKKFPNEVFYIWGAKLERGHQIPKMIPNKSLVLFRRGQRVFRLGAIHALFVKPELAEYLWGVDEYGETWSIVYMLSRVRDVSFPMCEVNQVIGRKSTDNWQGMTALEGESAELAIAYIKQHIGK
ncbi:hypothetical protein KDA23_07140 [Candidatus Saccharibacteria bacterium]|nr:hypothetical protein [Candidatus Saccharibacteria bacterium]